MVSLKIKVTFDEEVLGTASGDPKVHETYIASNAPDAMTMKEEVEALGTEEVVEKSMTVFPKEPDKTPFVWNYQWKGFFKDSFGMLKKIPGTECSKIKAYKKEIDGLFDIQPRRIDYDLHGGQIGICQRPLRAQTMQGERVALASSETVPAGSSIIFEIRMLLDTHEKAVLEALDYGAIRGFGQWRNSGKGIFHYEILERKSDKEWRRQ